MLSIKPELHNIEQPQRRFEPQSTCAENFVKFFCDELTDIQTDMLITIPRIPAGGRNNSIHHITAVCAPMREIVLFAVYVHEKRGSGL